MNWKIVNINSIGKVIIRKSGRAKYLSIKIKPNEGVSVTIPKKATFAEGERFAKSKKDWILKHLPKVEAIEKSFLVFDETTNFKTRNHRLIIEKADVENVLLTITESIVKIKYPQEQNVKDSFIQETIKYGINETLRMEAKLYLPQKVEELANRFGFRYNNLVFKNVKTRWGSCSSKNNINLNVHLMRLPNRLIDYVILHELTHTVHKNHSKNFWNALEKSLPGSKILDKELNCYSPQKLVSFEE